MNTTAMTILIVAAIAVVLFTVLKKKKKKESPPNTDNPNPQLIDGIYVGVPLYADEELKKCVQVIDVVEGLVSFFVLDGDNPEEQMLPRGQFLSRYNLFPEGCPFSE